MAKTNSGYSEDWLPIKQILNGMIQLDNGEYVTGIKVHPRNIFIVDQGLQNAIIGNLRNFYNSINFEFWLIIADRPVDISVYLSQLQILYNNTTSPIGKKLIMEDINKANMFMSAEYNVVDTEYYILFKEKRMELIQKKLHTLISGLANSGLNSTQTSNDDLRMILDNFLNGGTHTNFGTVMS
ncbi:MAG: hypothetical protein E7163_02820 [Firmicutes bacterium]|nr:hypothetical protein [Bacillota bacterium]